jgi:hypothetical protein
MRPTNGSARVLACSSICPSVVVGPLGGLIRLSFQCSTGVCTTRDFATPLTRAGRMVEPKRPSHATLRGAYGIRTALQIGMFLV